MPTTLSTTTESALHLTDVLLVSSNVLIVLATIALAYYTAKVANETAREVRKDDARIIRLLVRKNRAAKHAKGADNVRKIQ